jgi:superfamily II DNA helicase RecQ
LAFKFFVVPIHHPEPAESQFNQFLASHQILKVSQEWFPDGANASWCFCVSYVAGGGPSSKDKKAQVHSKIDYKEVLDSADFAVYSRLRALRKQVAEAEAIPLFAVFHNEQIAEMARRRVKTISEMRKIEGIGEKKAAKYGNAFLQAIHQNPTKISQ